jgi:hypothetical protein
MARSALPSSDLLVGVSPFDCLKNSLLRVDYHLQRLIGQLTPKD